jgi:hypothetical protein
MDACDVFVNQLVSPSLKHLHMARCYSSEYTRVLISLPSLVSLELIDCEGRIPLLGSLPSLARAIVKLHGHCTDLCSNGRFDCCDDCDGCYDYYGPGYDRHSCVFLKGLSEATNLELLAFSDVVRLHCFSLNSYYFYFTKLIQCIHHHKLLFSYIDSHISRFPFVPERPKHSLFDPALLHFSRLFSTGI